MRKIVLLILGAVLVGCAERVPSAAVAGKSVPRVCGSWMTADSTKLYTFECTLADARAFKVYDESRQLIGSGMQRGEFVTLTMNVASGEYRMPTALSLVMKGESELAGTYSRTKWLEFGNVTLVRPLR